MPLANKKKTSGDVDNKNDDDEDEEESSYIKQLNSNLKSQEATVTREQLDILKGKFVLNNLPKLNPRTIRLYLCAPFKGIFIFMIRDFDSCCWNLILIIIVVVEDTQAEVNHLVRHVVPKLREFAIYRYGVEFQLVDLHWCARRSSLSLK